MVSTNKASSRRQSNMVSLSRQWITLLLLLCLHITAVGTSSVEAAKTDGAAAAVHESDGIDIRGLDESSLIDLQNGLSKDGRERSDSNVSKQFISSNTTEIFHCAIRKAIGGGVPGAIAGVVQVFGLMWLRTVINYQYRYGSTFLQALTHLYTTGGLPRLYSGLPFALIQAPLIRFVSTAANDGVSLFLQNNPFTEDWGPAREVAVAAVVVGLFRGMLMPIDTCKTVLQIEGGWGFEKLMEKVKKGNVGILYSGAVANAVSSFIGHYPWFYTYNLLSRNEALMAFIPTANRRNAFIGFVSSIVSDTVANFMRVIKTTKQALAARGDDEDVEHGRVAGNGATYREAIGIILAADGLRGLFGRGLKTRIFANALQSIVFTVIWRGLADQWAGAQDVQTKIDILVDGNTDEERDNEGEYISR